MESTSGTVDVRSISSQLMVQLQCHQKLTDYLKKLDNKLKADKNKLNRAIVSGNTAAEQMYRLRIQVTTATKEMYQLALERKWGQVNTMATRAMNSLGLDNTNDEGRERRHTQMESRYLDRHHDVSNVILRDLVVYQRRCL